MKYIIPQNDYYQLFFFLHVSKHKFWARKRNVSLRFLLHTEYIIMLLMTIKIDHEQVLFSESSVFQIY